MAFQLNSRILYNFLMALPRLVVYLGSLMFSTMSLFALHGCSKKEEAAAPTNGEITGRITPIDGATSVVVSDQSNNPISTAVPDDKTGAFTFNNLKAGGYFVSFVPSFGYLVPTAKSVAVVGGQTLDIGTVSVQGNGTPHGTVTWRVNGVDYRTTKLSGSIQSPNSSITAVVENGNTTDNLYLTIYNFNGRPGTYTVGTSTTAPFRFYGIYARFVGNDVVIEYNTGSASPGFVPSGSLNITASDTNAKTLQGNFTFLGGAPRGSVPVTNGTFDIHY